MLIVNVMFIIYCMQKFIAQPDNSKCRYTDTRLQEGRRNTLVAVDGPLLRHSAFHPSVGGSENMSVELRHIEYGGDGDCEESHEVCSALLGWAGLGWAALVIISTSSVKDVKGAARGCKD